MRVYISQFWLYNTKLCVFLNSEFISCNRKFISQFWLCSLWLFLKIQTLAIASYLTIKKNLNSAIACLSQNSDFISRNSDLTRNPEFVSSQILFLAITSLYLSLYNSDCITHDCEFIYPNSEFITCKCEFISHNSEKEITFLFFLFSGRNGLP